MLLLHSWFRFICEFCLQIISVSMVFIMKHFIQPHLEGRTCECTSSFTCTKSSMSWDVVDSFGRTLREEICIYYIMVLLWKERICPTICQRKDLSKTFLMFLYFRISVLTFYIKLLYVVRVLGVNHLYIWNTGTNTKYYIIGISWSLIIPVLHIIDIYW